MTIVKVGSRWLNLSYLIQAFEGDGSEEAVAAPGCLTVVMMAGERAIIPPDVADPLRKRLDELSSGTMADSSLGEIVPGHIHRPDPPGSIPDEAKPAG
jgi:hypothetical protein